MMLLILGSTILSFAQEELFNTIEKPRNIGMQKEKGENAGFVIKAGTGSFYLRFRVPYNATLVITMDTPPAHADLTVLDTDKTTTLANFKLNGKGNQLECGAFALEKDYYIRATPAVSGDVVVRLNIKALPSNAPIISGLSKSAADTDTVVNTAQAPVPPTENPEKDSNSMTMFYILGIGIAIVLIIVIVVVLKKRKQ